MNSSLKGLLFVTAILVTLLIMPEAVKADPIVLTLTSPLQSGSAGSLLTFQGTFANGGEPLRFVNSVGFTSPSGFLFDASDFFAAVPIMVDPGFSIGPTSFFTVFIDSTVAPGSYTGSFNVLGGDNEGDENTLVSHEFTIEVRPATSQVTEPATLFLFGSGVSAFAILFRRRHKRKLRSRRSNGS